MRKQSAPVIRPGTLPPTSVSESAESGPAACALAPPGRLSMRMPMANSAGSPAPAMRPTTTICQSAVRSIQLFMTRASSRSGGCGLGGDGRLGRRDRPGPFGIHIVVADPAAAGPDVDGRGDREQQEQVHDDAGVAADGV